MELTIVIVVAVVILGIALLMAWRDAKLVSETIGPQNDFHTPELCFCGCIRIGVTT